MPEERIDAFLVAGGIISAWAAVPVFALVRLPVFALYVIGWRGLRLLFAGTLGGVLWAVFFTVVGLWTMRSWMKVVEVERLARVMLMNTEGETR